ncbi:MAG: class I tRNA ligase family protein, partial [Pseudomonadota bacterium]
PLTHRKVLDRVVARFREHNADIWYEEGAAELIGPGVHCRRCGGSQFRKESDILDVWFDSGCSHLAVLTPENDLTPPADLYLEGGDQHRGWFHSSLLIGVGLEGAAPYRMCATHGWTLDEEGRAMSKSLGNGIEPDDIIERHGAELLRLWVSSVEFYEDVRLSDTILTRLTEAYRKLRNTFRYVLGNLHDFDPARDAVPAGDLLEIDRWILVRLENLIDRCRVWYDELGFHKVFHAVYDFAASDLSAIYFDILKDRLYTSSTRAHARRSAQTALYRINYALVRLLAPILSFTSEEVWTHMQRPGDAPESVHLALCPEPEEVTEGLSGEDRSRLANWDRLMPVRAIVLKNLETARQGKFIGAPLEAKVHLSADGDLFPLLQEYASELPSLFIVSQVVLAPGAGVSVRIERAEGTKCERCWKYTTDVGSNPEFPTACAACARAVLDDLSQSDSR